MKPHTLWLMGACLGAVVLMGCDRHDHAHDDADGHDHAHEHGEHEHHDHEDHDHDHHGHDHHDHNHGEGHRQHGAHIHGVARLALVVEGETVTIELGIPGVDAVGFESHPETDEERATVAAVADQLRQGERLLSFGSASQCQLEDAEVLSSLLEPEPSGSRHAEFQVYYSFACGRTDRLSRVEVGLFEAFPALERVNVMWISDDDQGRAILQANNPEVRLR